LYLRRRSRWCSNGCQPPGALQRIRVARPVNPDLIDRLARIDPAFLDRFANDLVADAESITDCTTG
jgi:hypothetical protein